MTLHDNRCTKDKCTASCLRRQTAKCGASHNWVHDGETSCDETGRTIFHVHCVSCGQKTIMSKGVFDSWFKKQEPIFD